MKKTVLVPIAVILAAAVILFGLAFGLSGVGNANARANHLEMMRTLLPGSENFTLETYDGDDANIRSVHKAENGFVIETCTYGYAGEITMFVAVNNEGKVMGLLVQDMEETPGLGGKALTDYKFLCQFLNESGEFAVASVGEDAFSGATADASAADSTGETVDVDAITGATVTSKAIVRCVNSAVSYVTGADISSGATSWGG